MAQEGEGRKEERKTMTKGVSTLCYLSTAEEPNVSLSPFTRTHSHLGHREGCGKEEKSFSVPPSMLTHTQRRGSRTPRAELISPSIPPPARHQRSYPPHQPSKRRAGACGAHVSATSTSRSASVPSGAAFQQTVCQPFFFCCFVVIQTRLDNIGFVALRLSWSQKTLMSSSRPFERRNHQKTTGG